MRETDHLESLDATTVAAMTERLQRGTGKSSITTPPAKPTLPSKPMQREETPPTLESAASLLNRGYAVIPAPAGEKGIQRGGWKDERHTGADLPRVFKPGDNIAVLNGEPSGNRIDVDLDCNGAVALAEDFLPPTGEVFGHTTRPRSHRIYRVTSGTLPKSKKFATPGRGGETLVEIRSTGSYTLAPGSRHPDGDVYRWDSEGEPASVDGGELSKCMARLAAATLVVRNYPGRGNRHNMVLALAGVLLRNSDWEVDEVEHFIRAVAVAAGDTEVEDRLAAVHSTAEKLSADEPTTGLPTLADALGQDAAKLFKKWLGLTADGEDDKNEGNHDGSGHDGSQAQALVKSAEGADLFHDGDKPYATVDADENSDGGGAKTGSHRETYSVNGRGFRLWLCRRYWATYHKAPGSQAVQDALSVLAGKAMFEGQNRPIAIRIADFQGALYVDLCNDRWEAVRITPDGWEIVIDPPVRFIRRRGMLALPTPIRGGSINELRPLLNAGNETTWRLLVAWLVGTFRPRGPYTVLSLNGEQGSAKSTAGRLLRQMIDPNLADLRAAPRDDRDLMIAATNAWVVAFDNLSSLSAALSDGLCRLATGAGFATRELFSDDEERIFFAARPIAINGIEEVATRPDLLERCIIVNLPPIADDSRRTEEGLGAEYERVRPRVLGAVLDAVSAALKNLPSVKLPKRPRMADFAEWVVAAEPALPWSPGGFMEVYALNRDTANELALESSAIGPAILALLSSRTCWNGTARDLLAELESGKYTDNRTCERRDWPRTPKGASNALRRIAPTLRRLGVDVDFERKASGNRPRTIYLEQTGKVPSAQSPSSLNRVFDAENAVLQGRSGTVVDQGRDGTELGEGRNEIEGGTVEGRNTVENLSDVTNAPVDTYNYTGTVGTVRTVVYPTTLGRGEEDKRTPPPPRYSLPCPAHNRTRRETTGGNGD